MADKTTKTVSETAPKASETAPIVLSNAQAQALMSLGVGRQGKMAVRNAIALCAIAQKLGLQASYQDTGKGAVVHGADPLRDALKTWKRQQEEKEAQLALKEAIDAF